MLVQPKKEFHTLFTQVESVGKPSTPPGPAIIQGCLIRCPSDTICTTPPTSGEQNLTAEGQEELTETPKSIIRPQVSCLLGLHQFQPLRGLTEPLPSPASPPHPR